MHWNSETLPAQDQFAAWREACCQHVYAVTPEREEHGGFRGGIVARRIGELDVVDVQCDGHRVSRRAEDIRRAPSDTYYLYLQVGEGAWFTQRGRHILAARGDVVLADPNVPFSTGTTGDFQFCLWRLPRRGLDTLLALPDHLPMIHLQRDSAECALLSSCLSALALHGERVDPRLAEPASEALLRLVALTAGIAPEFHAAGRDATRAATRARILRHIDEHYRDATLSPASAAKALGMSVRKLHLLCAESGRSFGERLAEVRLAEARRLLTSPASLERPIAEIAFAVGFNDVSTFYRAFRAHGSGTPGDVRAACMLR